MFYCAIIDRECDKLLNFSCLDCEHYKKDKEKVK